MITNYSDYEKFLPSDNFYMKDKLLEENHNIHLFVKDSLLMKNTTAFYEYKNCNLISLEKYGRNINISYNLLRDLISNEGMYKYLLSCLDYDDETAVYIQLFIDGKQVDFININKADLVLAYKTMDTSNLTTAEQMRLVIIYSLTDANTCLNHYKDEVHRCVIDSKEYEYPINELIRILIMSKKEFNKFIRNKVFTKYSKEIISYMLVDIIEKEGIFDKYVFDDYVYDRYEQLREFRIIDYESLNKMNKSDDINKYGESLLDQFSINKELERQVIEDMNKDYDDLEKSIYIYMRLCDILTYDEDHYASNSKFEKKGIHRSISDIAFINANDNKIVSYEFMLIYAKFLRKYGIKYSLNLNSLAGYSEAQSSIKIRHGEYLVSIDLFSSIIRNDMSNVKIGRSLTGIKSDNTNEVTHKKFLEKLYNVYINYQDIIRRNKAFNDDVSKYNSMYKHDVDINDKDRLFSLLKLICRRDLKGIDAINYILEIYNIIFVDNEDITINVLSATYYQHSRPVILLTYNNGDDYIYYLIDNNQDKNVRIVDRKTLDDLLSKNILNSIDDREIIGMEEQDDREATRKM